MNGEPVALRIARADDAPALGLLHATGWRETYADLVPAAMLAASTPEARTALWRKVLDPIGSPPTHVVIAEIHGEMVGFGACGPQWTAELARDGFDGEVSALYVRRPAQGQGIGTAIFHKLAGDLAARGFGAFALWVLRDNAKARRFYERAGGALIGARDERRADGILSEISYGWRRLDNGFNAVAPLRRKMSSGTAKQYGDNRITKLRLRFHEMRRVHGNRRLTRRHGNRRYSYENGGNIAIKSLLLIQQ